MYERQVFIDRFNSLRDRKGLTYEDISRNTGLNSSTIRKAATSGNPSAKTLYAMCDYLNVSADYLLGLSDNY
ncbi:helix-turn-helix domain-containing protein [Abyssicoccus albus]|uniref:Helix-turn-helix protein n=1 Tax=Abyssicoccus albus TaxID=1817405 RepID=A0A3N5BY96_9BACL|nr:helix-turn-helix transcriptional regulator [Abyssicoccus albus]RPF54778.1 helix-turn-helix protein [Abyssicoccus albus]